MPQTMLGRPTMPDDKGITPGATIPPLPTPTAKRQKYVQLNIMFNCDTDTEAVEVKAAVDEALKPWPKALTTFTIAER